MLNKSKIIYEKSQQILAGPSTFGKDVDQFAYGITPYGLNRAEGAYTWDIDGNKYIDTIMALGSITLGHCHPYLPPWSLLSSYHMKNRICLQPPMGTTTTAIIFSPQYYFHSHRVVARMVLSEHMCFLDDEIHQR